MSDDSHACEGHHGPPPSAAGLLDPFGMRAALGPAPGAFAAEAFLTGFLEDLAAGCEAAGATVIGHLKCFLSSGKAGLHCNLTSTRLGARCVRATSDPIPLAQPAELHLAVLVYGLSADTISALAEKALDARLSPHGIAWKRL